MKKYFPVLKNSELFESIDDDISQVLSCLNARIKKYNSEDIILLAGTCVQTIGIIVEGSALITKEDMEGNRVIISEVIPGGIFGESLGISGIKKSPVTVVTADGCEVMWLDAKRLITTCSSACPFHSRLIRNLLQILSSKNLYLNSRIDILTQKTLRDKLIQFFNNMVNQTGRREFEIGFTREELADFIFANRSAVSRELCAMREAGLITFNKNQFKIL